MENKLHQKPVIGPEETIQNWLKTVSKHKPEEKTLEYVLLPKNLNKLN